MKTRLLFLFLALGLCSCADDRHEPEQHAGRVLLVYVATDSNLSGYEQAKLQGLRDGWTGRKTDHIVAYIDKGRGADARLIEISDIAPGGQPREIAVYGTENSASAATLERVIADVVGIYPDAGSYGLLVFSHASGWLPQGLYNQFSSGVVPDAAIADNPSAFYPATAPSSRSIIVDGDDEMELRDFAAAIPGGVFDYIVFEACFMAGIEVAYELKDKTPYIFASSAEIVDPGFAPVYPSAVSGLFGRDLAGFGRKVFAHTLTYAESNPQRSATYSVISTAALGPLADFVRRNCDLDKNVDIAGIQRFDRLKSATLFFDFEDYYGRLLSTDAQRAELSRLIADCVKWKAATADFMLQSGGYNGFRIENHSGLTAYIPQAALPGLNAAYQNLQWSESIR